MKKALERFREALESANPRKVSVGSRTVQLFSAGDLEARQRGYSRDPEERGLTGNADGDWRRPWIVFACEDPCGDPIFVDLSAPGWPVYTAMHGMGAWDPMLIAASFSRFLEGLAAVERLSEGRACPVELEANPLCAADKRRLRKDLKCLGTGADRDFWTSWFDG